MTFKKIINTIRKNFKVKISYHDSYLNEDMTPEDIEKETLEMLKTKRYGNNKRKIK